MKVYTVGGAVRDELLGLPVKERDYVVVGATPEEMVRQGYKPVGKDFPVFLHPKTHEEYALARTERKSGRGYKGFTVYAAPEVTLEEDLKRRDLTINAIAKAEDGTLDRSVRRTEGSCSEGVLRHVSEAFAEDPVRILRVARFAARFGFSVAAETMALMRADGGLGRSRPPGRRARLAGVRQGPGRAAARRRCSRCCERCGLLRRNLPGDQPAARDASRARCRRASRCSPGRSRKRRSRRLASALRAPNEVRELALTACRSRPKLRSSTPGGLLDLFKTRGRVPPPGALRRAARGRALAEPGIDKARIERALRAAAAVDAGAIAAKAAAPGEIPRLLDEARVRAIGEA